MGEYIHAYLLGQFIAGWMASTFGVARLIPLTEYGGADFGPAWTGGGSVYAMTAAVAVAVTAW